MICVLFCLECNIFNGTYLFHNFLSFVETHYRGKRIRCCNVIIIITSVVAVIIASILGTPVVDNVVKYIIVLFINVSDFDVADINPHTPPHFHNLTRLYLVRVTLSNYKTQPTTKEQSSDNCRFFRL